jgi:NADPH:quinone reductase-like Zn-dependent oxidoreductase
MKSYWMVSDDKGSRLELREVDTPQPGAGQVLVKMHAASLNRGEFIHGHGLHAAGSAKAAGMEGAGEIVQLGEGVTGWKAGDRVMGRCPGGFSQYALMDVRETMPVPSNLSLEEAASIPLTFLVTHDLLVLQGQLQAGQWLLVNGVSSGVGVASLQMAKVLGAKVIGTSGSQAKLDQLQPLGLDVGICTRAPDFHDAVMQATEGRGANLAVNTVGGTVFAESLRSLAFQGRMGIVGYVDGTLTAPIDLETLHAKRLTVFGVSNKLRTPAQRADGIAQFAAQILPAFADGRIRPMIDRAFAFNDMPHAKAHMESNQHTGKIVLSID